MATCHPPPCPGLAKLEICPHQGKLHFGASVPQKLIHPHNDFNFSWAGKSWPLLPNPWVPPKRGTQPIPLFIWENVLLGWDSFLGQAQVGENMLSQQRELPKPQKAPHKFFLLPWDPCQDLQTFLGLGG
jgi:hypothetical protein